MINSISVFFPCYNDAGTIASMAVLAFKILEKHTPDHEVIIINDGSHDHSSIVLEELTKKYNKLKIVNHAKNKGYGGALRSGFSTCTKDLIFYTDGDAQYNVLELENMLKALTPETDIINGYKIERSDPLHRIIIGKIYNYLMKFIFSIKLKDIDCDFRLIRKKVFDKVKLYEDSGTICVEMIKKLEKAGFKFKEIPVHHYFRAYGKSQFFNFSRLFKTFINLFKLWYKLIIKKQYNE